MASRVNDGFAGAPSVPRPNRKIRSPWTPTLILEPDTELSGIRRFSFQMALILLFLRFSMVHQLITVLLGVRLPILYVFGVPALVGIALTGGVGRTFQSRTAWYWACFAGWMLLAVPFSWWKSDSLRMVFTYLRTDFIMLFVVAGLAKNWQECKTALRAVAWGAVVVLLFARMFQNPDYQARLGLDFGSIANPNDYACHLLLSLPFLMWAGFASKSVALRAAALCGTGYGIYLILGTASRGAAIALAVAIGFYFLRGTLKQRVVLAILMPIAVALLIVVVPRDSLRRIRSFSLGGPDAPATRIETVPLGNESGISLEARESSEARQYLLRKSITYALHHPVFGIGPGQFSAYEGSNNRVVGTHGLWHETHNAYTQVASECGIPALLFFLAGIVSAFRLLGKTRRQALESGQDEIAAAAFYMQLAMAGFCAGIAFLSFAYFFYLPAMLGLAIALARVSSAPVRRPVSPISGDGASIRYAP